MTDAQLALTGNGRDQIVDMVNWWIKVTTPVGQWARQVAVDLVEVGVDKFGLPIMKPQLIEATPIAGSGLVSAGDLVGGIEVNGHSLGGYLASAFTRLFGAQAHVTHTSTFNSAGFAPGSEAVFQQWEDMIGPGYGLGRFPSQSEQTNYFARYGINVTTNTFWFSQVGHRVDLFNEESTWVGTGVPNHYMYKLTDSLALTAAMERLDTGATVDAGLTIQRASQFFEMGGSRAEASLEGVLDGLRRLIQGPSVTATTVGDASDSAASRLQFHVNLKALQESSMFVALAGRVTLTDASGSQTLTTDARADFAALATLLALSPVRISARTNEDKTTVESALATAWDFEYAAWIADKALISQGRPPTNISNNWLNDRLSMLNVLAIANARNVPWETNGGQITGVGLSQPILFSDLESERIFIASARGASFQSSPDIQSVVFGTRTGEVIDGRGGMDRLYAGAGDDILSGLAGDDYLEGGTGIDTYEFSGAFGTDTVLDTGGQGVLKFDGVVLSGTLQRIKGLANVWQDSTGLYMLTWKPGSDGRGDLIIAKRTSATNSTLVGIVNVRNFANGDLGLTLSTTEKPPAASTVVGSIKVYLTNPLLPGTAQFDPNAKPDYDGVGVRAYTDLAPIAHWVNARENGGQIITLGDGADFVDTARPYQGPGRVVWTPGPGQDQDYVSTAGGNDEVRTGYGSDYIGAGTGNDVIFAAGSGDLLQNHDAADAGSGDVVDAGDGNDSLWGSMGPDVLYGGDGADGMMGMEGNDLLVGGDGDDALNGDGGYAADAAVVDRVIGALLGYTTGGDDVLFGGAGTDRLVGGVGKDDLDGGAGDDALFGDTDSYYVPTGNMAWIPGQFQLADNLDGGGGNDFLLGGGGDDTLTGGAGNDRILGDQYDTGAASIPLEYQGDDWIDGGDGDDVIFGDGGNDSLFAGSGVNTLYGGVGDDLLTAGGRSDKLFGGDGADTLVSVGRYDELEGGSGIDLYVVPSTPGQTTIKGFNAEDSLDWIVDSEDVTVLRGNADLDSVILHSVSGANVTFDDMFSRVVSGDAGLATVSFADGVQWTGQELLARAVSIATDGDDQIVGFKTDDVLLGLGGDDRLEGAGGSDDFRGGLGRDIISNSAGSSVVHYDRGDGFDIAHLSSNAEFTNVLKLGANIAPGDVLIRASYDADLELQFVDGDGPTEGMNFSGAFSAEGPASSDLLDRIEFADGTVWDQQEIRRRALLPTEGNDSIQATWTSTTPLRGLGGDDVLFGTWGDDILDGGAGNDQLKGSFGNDVYVGEAGNDRFVDDTYGTSNDVYRFNRGDGRDSINDGSGSDAIEFGPGILPGEIAVLTGYGNYSLLVGGGDRIDVGGTNMIESFRFSDGTVWGMTQIAQLFAQPQMGTPEDDRIDGYSSNNDQLSGGAGNDDLNGQAGDDVLDGGRGDDTIIGDGGNDVFRLSLISSG